MNNQKISHKTHIQNLYKVVIGTFILSIIINFLFTILITDQANQHQKQLLEENTLIIKTYLQGQYE